MKFRWFIVVGGWKGIGRMEANLEGGRVERVRSVGRERGRKNVRWLQLRVILECQ